MSLTWLKTLSHQQPGTRNNKKPSKKQFQPWPYFLGHRHAHEGYSLENGVNAASRVVLCVKWQKIKIKWRSKTYKLVTQWSASELSYFPYVFTCFTGSQGDQISTGEVRWGNDFGRWEVKPPCIVGSPGRKKRKKKAKECIY